MLSVYPSVDFEKITVRNFMKLWRQLPNITGYKLGSKPKLLTDADARPAAVKRINELRKKGLLPQKPKRLKRNGKK